MYISTKMSFKVCENGDKYQITQGGGSYTIVISDPTPEDTGCYKYKKYLFQIKSALIKNLFQMCP